MRIGYFGGSFDPPHRGHLAVARTAAAAFHLQRVLFVPTGHQPLKHSGPIASYDDRLAMVRLLCEDAADSAHGETLHAETIYGETLHAETIHGKTIFVASTLEAPLPNDTPNYTVDTLAQLALSLSPLDELFVLLGADAFLQLPQWRSPEQLLAMADWIVVSRPGFDLAHLKDLSLTEAQRRRLHLLPGLADPTSATALRHALAMLSGQSRDESVPPLLTDHVPPAVLAYIVEHKLYSTE